MRRTERDGKRARRHRNREALFIGIAVLVLALILGIYDRSLIRTGNAYAEQAQYLQSQLDAESERAEELEEKSIFMQTGEYIKKIARERLGLVDPEDSIVKPSE